MTHAKTIVAHPDQKSAHIAVVRVCSKRNDCTNDMERGESASESKTKNAKVVSTKSA